MTKNELAKQYAANVRTAAYCRQRVYTCPPAQAAAYESMANQAARKATAAMQALDKLEARNAH